MFILYVRFFCKIKTTCHICFILFIFKNHLFLNTIFNIFEYISVSGKLVCSIYSSVTSFERGKVGCNLFLTMNEV